MLESLDPMNQGERRPFNGGLSMVRGARRFIRIAGSPGSMATSLEPDEGGHAPAFAIAPVRIETLRFGIGTGGLHADRRHACRSQTARRNPGEIALPSAAVVRCESCRSAGICAHEGLTDLLAHLEVGLPDAGADPGDELSWGNAERIDCGFEHASGEPAPA